MKKSLLGLAAICGTVFADVETASVNSTHEGWYLGAGVNYQHTTCKVTQSAFYNQGCRRDGEELTKPGSGLVGGSILGGYGALVNGYCYVGAEVVLDVSKDSEHTCEFIDDRFDEGSTAKIKVDTKVVGFVPSVAVRLGYLVTSIDTLFYVKAGGAYVETKGRMDVEDRTPQDPILPFSVDLSKKKFVPTIGVGFEKGLCDRFNVRLEGSWRFSSSKERSGSMVDAPQDAWFKGKVRSSGYVIRLISSYVF